LARDAHPAARSAGNRSTRTYRRETAVESRHGSGADDHADDHADGPDDHRRRAADMNTGPGQGAHGPSSLPNWWPADPSHTSSTTSDVVSTRECARTSIDFYRSSLLLLKYERRSNYNCLRRTTVGSGRLNRKSGTLLRTVSAFSFYIFNVSLEPLYRF